MGDNGGASSPSRVAVFRNPAGIGMSVCPLVRLSDLPMPDHILTILAVADLPRAANFYRAVFNWPVIVDVPVYVEFALPRRQRLGLYQREAFARNTGQLPAAVEPGQLTGTEIYIYCEDPAAALERITSTGGRLLSALSPRDWGDTAAYAADPDGNVVVVARPT
jgi:predicted enzyme related to lactoylglutathione lyase